jgi:hypothetical protein
MLRPMTMAGLAVSMLIQPGYARAEIISGNKLHEYCQKYDARQFVFGYVTSVVDTSKIVCVPPGVTVGQLADVVCGYLSNHPEKRHYDGAGLASQALNASFPCPKMPAAR